MLVSSSLVSNGIGFLETFAWLEFQIQYLSLLGPLQARLKKAIIHLEDRLQLPADFFEGHREALGPGGVVWIVAGFATGEGDINMR